MYRYTTLNTKFSNFEKTAAGKDSILKLLVGGSPSKYTSELADIATTGAKLDEPLMDQIKRNTLARIEQGRRRGALEGMMAGGAMGSALGAGGAGLIGRSDEAMAAVKALGDAATADDILQAAYGGANPLAMLGGAGVGALGLGYAGKKIGAGAGRLGGLVQAGDDVGAIMRARAENKILSRM